MRTLVVEDDITSRMILVKILSQYSQCDTAENGHEALDLFAGALKQGQPYDMVFMDIMMPVMDGQNALKKIREIESEQEVPIGQEVKAVMTTALSDTKNVTTAFFQGQADAYLSKPISREKVEKALQEIGVLEK